MEILLSNKITLYKIN